MGEIIDLNQLLELRKRWRDEQKHIVFTNGCFDILHAGHVTYLKSARYMGSLLIVGLNSDSSTRRLKGEKRPIVPEKERAELLAALACVDYVVIFDDDTAVELVKYIRPDVYVKGGDYTLYPTEGSTTKPLPEGEIVDGYGGIVSIIPLVEGNSTTDIIGTILERYGSKCD